MTDSSTVADRFLSLARERGVTLTPMQLLKLVYIAHGWMLGLYRRPLIGEEIQAWQYGPVIPRLYNAIRGFRSQPVQGPLKSSNGPELDDEERSVVDQVFDIYGRMTGPELSRLTHAPGSPWALTYAPGAFGTVIPNDIIEDHYSRLAAAGATAA